MNITNEQILEISAAFNVQLQHAPIICPKEDLTITYYGGIEISLSDHIKHR